MNLWKLLVVMCIAVLPFALVAVGQAQQSTCWDLRPVQEEDTEDVDIAALDLHQHQDYSGNVDATRRRREASDEAENIAR